MVRVAAIQARPIGGLLSEKNLQHALELLDKVRGYDVDIACFPEGYPSTGLHEISKKASDIGSYVVATFIFKDKEKRYESVCTLIGPDGEVIGKQGKTTLLWVFEENLLEPVDSLPVYDTNFGKVGIARCSEIIYPEPMLMLTRKGTDIVFVVSNWNSNVIHLWHRILLVRSWENWIPIVGVNTAVWVKHKLIYADYELEPRYGGYSMIILPEDVSSMDEFIVKPYGGEVMFTEDRLIKARAGADEEILVGDIDVRKYSDFRWNVFFRNKRLTCSFAWERFLGSP